MNEIYCNRADCGNLSVASSLGDPAYQPHCGLKTTQR